ncbi:MAG: JAB domain-containing protein [Saccharofermentanales bacterium]|jgi:DNA repair protein RadC
MRLYEYFNCKDGNELFSLMENNSPEVKDLLQFYEAVEQNMFCRKNEELDGLIKVKKFIEKEGCAPVNGKMLLCLLDVKLQIVSYKQYIIDSSNPEKTIRNVNQYIIDQDYNNAILMFSSDDFFNSVSEYVKDELTQSFSLVDMKLVDVVLASENRNQFFSLLHMKEGSTYPIEASAWEKSNKAELIEKNYILTSESLSEAQLNLKGAEEYKEFTDYFVKRSIKGLDAIKDEVKIQNLIKILMHDDTIESFYRIDYDMDYKVKNLKLINRGINSEVRIDQRSILKGINLNSRSMFAVAHNHPSGNVEPSVSDISTTLKIEKIAKALNLKFIDHYIVSYGGITRISDHNLHLGNEKQAVIETYLDYREKNKNELYQTTFEDYEYGYL